ncbi:hypothetical protein H072_2373 [Dactylellina haptotyla CBS 200.50]|uniref:Uncharacterized protein n=1 Tax=Dactylellina haptotyla (strain CBS 200.50) TaxID=1284197 RepID=S8AL87_DACHA|nr:hypothetical protein H072_2373 [Dactylellina haptotyla CBS 200.50]
MSVLSVEAVTTTIGGQVIVFIPNIKTQEVPSISHPSTARRDTTMGGQQTRSRSSVLTTPIPTTLITSIRSRSRSVVVVTEVVTVTSSLSVPTPIQTYIASSESSSAIYTRPPEYRPAGIPYPVGPLITSEGPSPLETGGVHLPQPEFNGLAAPPSVIIGTFAALVGAGILCFLVCLVRRKRFERKLREANNRPRGPPVLPPIRRQPDSPVWFGQRKPSSTEMKPLKTDSVTSGGAPSMSTAPDMANRRQSVFAGTVLTTQNDPNGDILSTAGGTVDCPGIICKHEIEDLGDFSEKKLYVAPMSDNNDDVPQAATLEKITTEPKRNLNPTVEDGVEEPQAVNVPGAPFLVCELEDTSNGERYHTFIR